MLYSTSEYYIQDEVSNTSSFEAENKEYYRPLDPMQYMVRNDFLEAGYFGFSYHGTPVLSYFDNKDFIHMKHAPEQARNKYLTKVFTVTFLMYIATGTIVVVCCIPQTGMDTIILKYQSYLVVCGLVSGIVISMAMLLVVTFQRTPFSYIMCILETCSKSFIVTTTAIKLKSPKGLIVVFSNVIWLGMLLYASAKRGFDFTQTVNLLKVLCLYLPTVIVTALVVFTITYTKLNFTYFAQCLLDSSMFAAMFLTQLSLILDEEEYVPTEENLFVEKGLMLFNPMIHLVYSVTRFFDFNIRLEEE